MKTGLIKMGEFARVIKKNFTDDEITVIFEIGCLNARDAKYLKSQWPNASVYAIEGLEDNYNKYLKDLTDITCFNYVIFETEGDINYHKKETNGIHGVFNKGDNYGTEIQKSKSYRIDTVCKMHDIPNIDVVKLDVEGASLEVLRSFGDVLNTVKIMHIETEDQEVFEGQKLHSEVVEFLTAAGFEMIDISKVAISGGTGNQYDSIWINKSLK